MRRTAIFTVLILKTRDGYQAVCPAFPNATATATSGRTAYVACKRQVQRAVAGLLAAAEPIPKDPLTQARTLRLDLWYLRGLEDLQ